MLRSIRVAVATDALRSGPKQAKQIRVAVVWIEPGKKKKKLKIVKHRKMSFIFVARRLSVTNVTELRNRVTFVKRSVTRFTINFEM